MQLLKYSMPSLAMIELRTDTGQGGDAAVQRACSRQLGGRRTPRHLVRAAQGPDRTLGLSQASGEEKEPQQALFSPTVSPGRPRQRLQAFGSAGCVPVVSRTPRGPVGATCLAATGALSHRRSRHRLHRRSPARSCSFPCSPRKAAMASQDDIHGACWRCDAAAVHSILAATPASAMAADERGRLPLHLAAQRGDEAIVSLLLKASPAAAMAVDARDSLPLHLAARQGAEAVVRLLLAAAPASATTADRFDMLPLHTAA